MTSADIASPEVSGKTNRSNGRRTKASIEYVYAIGAADGAVKIGRAADPEKRLRALQTSHHQQLMMIYAEPCLNGEASTVEKKAHRMLEAERISGEWFRVSISEAGNTISQAADSVRIQANLREMEERGFKWSSTTTPRTDQMENGTRELSSYKREAAAWDFARQLEKELSAKGNRLKEQAA